MTSLHQPAPRYDLLQAPLIGRLLRWRWGRLVGQLLLLAVALLMLFDGFTGPKLAPTNIATVVTWVHYRGFVMFALLLVGNLFCMSCPFTLPRTLAKRLSGNGRRWPRRLRNKWIAITVLLLFFWLYEWLDLWASPLLTAWIILAYFVAAFVLEAFFAESPFCKYVCPLGTFNFVSSTISPLQISVRSQDTCHTCVGKECVNGSTAVLGCGTELFAPQIKSNLDCTLCLDCARACPHDNVALAWRNPLAEVSRADTWPRRWDVNLLILIFAFTGVGNAFGMVPPVYQLEAWLMGVLQTNNEGLILLLVFGVLDLLLPVGLGVVAAWGSRKLSQNHESLRLNVARYAPAFAPLAFAIWFAHYAGFHFLTGALAIIPVLQNFLLDVGISWFGQPNWALGPLLPMSWIDPFELLALLVGTAASLHVVGERARLVRDEFAAQLPWIFLLLVLAVSALVIMYLPMEMRGVG
ncbi:MAG: FesM [Ardenticatenaceae bacterium]|nr:FesM [Ardenticatenaceae bacterium]MCB8989741.1 FesM [Ardenticatenaceae bacterium]MCB9002800.1 FesM [Ardenticatenaceae bacterium]